MEISVGGRPAARSVCVIGGRTKSVRVRVAGVVSSLPRVPVERVGPRAVSVSVSERLLGLHAGASLTMTTSIRGRADRAGSGASSPARLVWRAWRLVGCAPRGATSVREGPRDTRLVGLSYDDGPSRYTPQILDLLAAAHAQATFYMLGGAVSSQRAVVHRVLREGHVIGNHSSDHALLPGADNIARAQRAIRDASGFTPCTFRPPYGARSALLDADVRSLGMRSILWSIDTNDWRLPGADRIARVALTARAGDIILMHDGGGPRSQTVAATRQVLDGLRARGLQPVSVERLLGFASIYDYRG